MSDYDQDAFEVPAYIRKGTVLFPSPEQKPRSKAPALFLLLAMSATFGFLFFLALHLFVRDF